MKTLFTIADIDMLFEGNSLILTQFREEVERVIEKYKRKFPKRFKTFKLEIKTAVMRFDGELLTVEVITKRKA